MDPNATWFEVVSPLLRQVHGAWLGARGWDGVPSVERYNDFARAARASASVCAVRVPDALDPVFRTVGASVTALVPEIRRGASFADIPSILLRSVWTLPLRRVLDAGTPESRVIQMRAGGVTRLVESLLLPFAGTRGQTVLVHGIYDFGPNEEMAA